MDRFIQVFTISSRYAEVTGDGLRLLSMTLQHTFLCVTWLAVGDYLHVVSV